ncbi:MAG: 2-succinyl-5-enolpyruvyl-6-hydroxy-3-cyclohexene-1-carboxylic-acid synthase [Acidimicrobiales bacterium]
MAMPPNDLQATFCATLVDEWVRCGVQHAVLSPGSRSTPLALALADEDRLALHVHHDERSAAFMAIGLALTAWEPTVVLTTSGTAAVELHAAVVEADHAGVPLLVCTADRPPELIDVAAPQAIDQTHLYGRSARWFHAPGVADEAARPRWRALAARAYAEATAGRGGPVHLNLAFREPLLGTAGPLPPGRAPEGASWTWRPPMTNVVDPVINVAEDLAGRRGLLVAGPGSGDAELVVALATGLGWPVLAGPQAPVWSVPGAVIPAADALLRVPSLGDSLRPEVVVHLGGPIASRVVGEWIAATGAAEIVVADHPRWVDPHGTAAMALAVDPDAQVAAWVEELVGVQAVDTAEWLGPWQEAGAAAQSAIEAVLAAEAGATEPGTAQALVDALPVCAHLVVSSSMPIRDLEWYVRASRPIRVVANRGANGIDGVVSTAVGVALGHRGTTALLIGDVAFLHDTNGLLGAAQRGVDLVIVVVDNDGGGIFSFLDQADVVDRARFEQLYGTPHGLDLVAVATALGASAELVDDAGPAVRAAIERGGLHVIVVRTERGDNRALHGRLNAAVADSTGALAG